MSSFSRYLVTGAAGFIGYHVAKRLLEGGREVLGIDNLNDYYDVRLKRDRLSQLSPLQGFRFTHVDLADAAAGDREFSDFQPEVVIHLGAQAGVRYSLQNPRAYVDSNIVGFLNVLESCRHHGVEHLVYASSSSVYGANTKVPFAVSHNVDHPVSLYAATKKSNELMAHTYSHLFGLPTTGLRFFTVYGPWGRPDMAYFVFTESILEGRPIKVFNNGDMRRDFTYIDDVVEGVVRTADKVATASQHWSGAEPDPGTSNAPYRVFNIGNNQPVELLRMIEALETALGKKAIKQMLPMQPGDVQATFADVDALSEWVGFRPSTELEDGLERFVAWYQQYFKNRAGRS